MNSRSMTSDAFFPPVPTPTDARKQAAFDYKGACNSYADALAAVETAKARLAVAETNRDKKFEALLKTL